MGTTSDDSRGRVGKAVLQVTKGVGGGLQLVAEMSGLSLEEEVGLKAHLRKGWI